MSWGNRVMFVLPPCYMRKFVLHIKPNVNRTDKLETKHGYLKIKNKTNIRRT